MSHDPTALPTGLPIPRDDGSADHLLGMVVPEVTLPATDGSGINLAAIPRSVVFCYPRTGQPGSPPPGGESVWNAIPGARGCTPQACGYRDHFAAIEAAGYRVFGVSTQDTGYQREAVERLGLPFRLLSDGELKLAAALRLPTFEVEGHTMLRRLSWVAHDGRIVRVAYPVFPSDTDAARALNWIRSAGHGDQPQA